MFSDNFELTLNSLSQKNQFLLVALHYFTAKLYQAYSNDSSFSERNSIERIASQPGFNKIINEPTHIIENSFLCILN